MDVPHRGVAGLHILALELYPRGVRARYHIEVQREREGGYQGGATDIRHQHAPVAHSAGQYSDYLRVRSHARGEEYHCDEHEQRGEHVHEVGDEVQVVVEHYLPQRSLVLHEVLYLLRDVEDDDYPYYQDQGHEESQDELSGYVQVYLLHPRPASYSLFPRFAVTESFQAAKSPFPICARACLTRSR